MERLMREQRLARRALLGAGVSGAAALWIAPSVAQAAASPAAPAPGGFAAALEAVRAEVKAPGAVAAYVRQDGRAALTAAGLDEVQPATPLQPTMRMLSGSTGKTFVAATALRLSRDGGLDLDAPIAEQLSARPWFSKLANGPKITTRHLLRHQSGLVDHVSAPAFIALSLRQLQDPDAAPSPEESIGTVLAVPPKFAPGAGFSYTDTGYLLAGLVIEAAGKAPLYAQVRRYFLDPLGLTLTDPSDTRFLPGLAQGHVDVPPGVPLPPNTRVAPGQMLWSPASEWAGGGFISNPMDLANWARALYGGAAMQGDYLPELFDGPIAGEGSSFRYGLGVFSGPSGLGRLHGHSGYFPGYRSDLAYFPEHGLALAMQFNTDRGLQDGAVIRMARERLAKAALAV